MFSVFLQEKCAIFQTWFVEHLSINMWGTISFGIFVINFSKKDLHSKVKNLNATQNGKSSEESHRATNKTKLAHKGYLFS